jgi:hypothetical protein
MANWSKKLPTKEGFYCFKKNEPGLYYYGPTIVRITKNICLAEAPARLAIGPKLTVWFFGNEQETPIEDPRFNGALWKEVKIK